MAVPEGKVSEGRRRGAEEVRDGAGEGAGRSGRK
jgi:hypothetical protein